nr:hypothetical protein [uncultured Erwinia sp.]
MKRFSEDEKEYMRRVVGKVPVEIIAEQLKRNLSSVRGFFSKQGLSIVVPTWRMERFWQHVTEQRQQKRASR